MEKSAQQEKLWAGLSKDRIAVLHARAIQNPNKPDSKTFLDWHARFHGGLSVGKTKKTPTVDKKVQKAREKRSLQTVGATRGLAVGGEHGGAGIAQKHGEVDIWSPERVAELNRKRRTVPVELSPAEKRLRTIAQIASKATRKSAKQFDVPTMKPDDRGHDDFRDVDLLSRGRRGYNEEVEQMDEGAYTSVKQFKHHAAISAAYHKAGDLKRAKKHDEIAQNHYNAAVERGESPHIPGQSWQYTGNKKNLQHLKFEEVEQMDEESPAWKNERESWARVQDMDRGSITGGKQEVKKHLNYLYAVHDHLAKFGKDVKQVKDKIERINRSKIAEELEQIDEGNPENKAKKKEYVRLLGFKAIKTGKVDPARGHIPQRAGREELRKEELEQVDEVKRFQTAYGWAGGRNERTGGTYKPTEPAKQKPKRRFKPSSVGSFNKFGKWTSGVREEIEQVNEMDKSQPSSSRGAEGLATGTKATPVTRKKATAAALKVFNAINVLKRTERKRSVKELLGRTETPQEREDRLSALATGDKAGRWAHGGKYEEVEMNEPTLNEVSKSEAEKVLGGEVKEKPKMPPGKQPAGYRYVRGLARKAMKAGMKKDEYDSPARRAMERELQYNPKYKMEEVELVEQDDTMEKKEMAQTQLHFIGYAAKEILEFIDMGGEIEEWYQNKLSKVQSEVESLHSYIEGEKRRTGMVEETDEKNTNEALDPVGREDKDIDNDGDTDKTDVYLHSKRKAIGKAIRDKLTKKMGK